MPNEGRSTLTEQIQVNMRLRKIGMTGDEDLHIPAHAYKERPPEPMDVKARELGWACCMHIFDESLVPDPALRSIVGQWVVKPTPGEG